MSMQRDRDERVNPMPSTDEGWWESVLAEEGRGEARESSRLQPRGAGRRESRGREANRITPDWAKVKELYLNDQVVSLLVTGTNRGGLLVEAEGLYGFVPFSHLVEIATQVEPIERAKVMDNYVGRTLELKVI